MNIIEFITHFPDEESCEIYLKGHRETTGFIVKPALASQNNTGLVRVSFLSAVNAEEGLHSKPGR
jgi:hypothetical protein